MRCKTKMAPALASSTLLTANVIARLGMTVTEFICSGQLSGTVHGT